ncbi:ROK family glucokinase [Enterococcus lactis]|nr:ROK family glucokinase [Enterococcus lactis]
MDKKIIGIDLGGTTAKFAILTPEGEIQQKWSIDTNILDDGKHIVPEIIESINHRLNLYNMKAEDFIGIGMGTPGSVDSDAGTVIGAYNLNWTEVQFVKKLIEAGTGIKFAIDNDANVAALGERWKGAGENDPDVVFVTLGTGVGGGIVAGGNLIHGVSGAGGEIGHITVDPEGFECTCGKRGCLETVSSATGVVRLGRYLAEEYAGDSKLKAMLDNGEEVTSKDIFEMAQEDDPFALMVVDRVCFYLGLACAKLGEYIESVKYCVRRRSIGGRRILRSRVEKYFKEFTFPQVRESTKIKLAELGNEAGVIGAASLALKFA